MSTATHAQQVHKTNKKLKASWVLQTVLYMFWFLLLFVGQLSMEEKGAFFSNIDFFQKTTSSRRFAMSKMCLCFKKPSKRYLCWFTLSVSRVEHKVWRGGGMEHPAPRTEWCVSLWGKQGSNAQTGVLHAQKKEQRLELSAPTRHHLSLIF